MKLKLTALFALLPLLACSLPSLAAAGPLEGFLGIPWGADRYQVKNILSQRPYTSRLSSLESSGDETMWWLTSFTSEFARVRVEFFHGEFMRAWVYITAGDNLENKYGTMVGWVREKYGIPDFQDTTPSFGFDYGCGWNFDEGRHGINVYANKTDKQVAVIYYDLTRLQQAKAEWTKDL